MDELELTDREAKIAAQVLREIRLRLEFLIEVGLSYLTMARAAATLSGGEAQRIRLATQIGSGLTGVLYVLDEPSIGLHQRDNRRLIDTLVKLTRPRQHADRRRARRRHDPHGRLDRRHRPGRGRARRQGRALRLLRGAAREHALDHRRLPRRAAARSRCRRRVGAIDPSATDHRRGRPGQQPAGRRRRASRSAPSRRSPA